MNVTLRFVPLLVLALCASAASADTTSAEAFHKVLDSFPLVDEIDTAKQAPVHEFPAVGSSKAVQILGRPARHLPMGSKPLVTAWVIGKGKGLEPGAAYVLEVEYPDDVPRAIFIANRGSDHVRGIATGTAVGDARQQFVQPSIESLNYPQSGKWQTYRSVFHLHDRFQGLYAQRDPKVGGRPHGPADGFHVIIFQTKVLNDPRSQGAAVGKIRLRKVPDVGKLYADVEPLPEGLPKRRLFYREEMADEVISAQEQAARGVDQPVRWHLYKARLNRVLGINTYAKDLLEFGHNQGWDAGDPAWFNNSQPPLTNLWNDLVPMAAKEVLDLLPYYEYKGGIGWAPGGRSDSLGWQRRAEKLYHTKENPRYTGIWWTEEHNVDLTDPETLVDAKRVVDRTIGVNKGKAPFAGAWFRTRDNHLPISFAAAAIERFKKANANDADAQRASRETLRASYEGDRKVYDRYINWWLDRRAEFLTALRAHVAEASDNAQAQLIFTPWISEQIPMMRDMSNEHRTPAQVTTDDTDWWKAYAEQVPGDSWFRWALMPTSYDAAVAGDYYRKSVELREEVSPEPHRSEPFHSAPGADPRRYRDAKGVMMTFPAGRLFTVARGEFLNDYRSPAGLTVIRHYTLNEDSHEREKGESNLPFDGQVGYVCADVDRTGPHVRLMEARAVAAADPTNLGMLCGSSFSTGDPGYVRQFNRAFTSVPALPSTIVAKGADKADVVVREIKTPKSGTYYLVVNTSMADVETTVQLPAVGGRVRDLVDGKDIAGSALELRLHSGELRSYHVAPAGQ